MRVTDAGETSVRQGKWRGGDPPYGYRSVSRGTLNYKGKPIFDVEIDPEQAEVVKKIYELYTTKHYGSSTLARHLNTLGHKTKEGHFWNGSMILKILQNKMYIGIYELGKWTKKRPIIASPVMPHLVIIDEATFEKAQQVRQSNNLNPDGVSVPRPTAHGAQLLTGILFCGECGRKYTSHYHVYRRERKNGTVWTHERLSYRCLSYHTPVERKETCHQKTYRVDALDKMVVTDTKALIKISDKGALLKKTDETLGENLRMATDKAKTLTRDKARADKELSKLKEAVMKSLMGEGAYSAVLLNEMITTKEVEVAETDVKLQAAETAAAELQNAVEREERISRKPRHMGVPF
jgi:hypothetical protein